MRRGERVPTRRCDPTAGLCGKPHSLIEWCRPWDADPPIPDHVARLADAVFDQFTRRLAELFVNGR